MNNDEQRAKVQARKPSRAQSYVKKVQDAHPVGVLAPKPVGVFADVINEAKPTPKPTKGEVALGRILRAGREDAHRRAQMEAAAPNTAAAKEILRERHKRTGIGAVPVLGDVLSAVYGRKSHASVDQLSAAERDAIAHSGSWFAPSSNVFPRGSGAAGFQGSRELASDLAQATIEDPKGTITGSGKQALGAAAGIVTIPARWGIETVEGAAHGHPEAGTVNVVDSLLKSYKQAYGPYLGNATGAEREAQRAGVRETVKKEGAFNYALDAAMIAGAAGAGAGRLLTAAARRSPAVQAAAKAATTDRVRTVQALTDLRDHIGKQDMSLADIRQKLADGEFTQQIEDDGFNSGGPLTPADAKRAARAIDEQVANPIGKTGRRKGLPSKADLQARAGAMASETRPPLAANNAVYRQKQHPNMLRNVSSSKRDIRRARVRQGALVENLGRTTEEPLSFGQVTGPAEAVAPRDVLAGTPLGRYATSERLGRNSPDRLNAEGKLLHGRMGELAAKTTDKIINSLTPTQKLAYNFSHTHEINPVDHAASLKAVDARIAELTKNRGGPEGVAALEADLTTLEARKAGLDQHRLDLHNTNGRRDVQAIHENTTKRIQAMKDITALEERIAQEKERGGGQRNPVPRLLRAESDELATLKDLRQKILEHPEDFNAEFQAKIGFLKRPQRQFETVDPSLSHQQAVLSRYAHQQQNLEAQGLVEPRATGDTTLGAPTAREVLGNLHLLGTEVADHGLKDWTNRIINAGDLSAPVLKSIERHLKERQLAADITGQEAAANEVALHAIDALKKVARGKAVIKILTPSQRRALEGLIGAERLDTLQAAEATLASARSGRLVTPEMASAADAVVRARQALTDAYRARDHAQRNLIGGARRLGRSEGRAGRDVLADRRKRLAARKSMANRLNDRIQKLETERDARLAQAVREERRASANGLNARRGGARQKLYEDRAQNQKARAAAYRAQAADMEALAKDLRSQLDPAEVGSVKREPADKTFRLSELDPVVQQIVEKDLWEGPQAAARRGRLSKAQKEDMANAMFDRQHAGYEAPYLDEAIREAPGSRAARGEMQTLPKTPRLEPKPVTELEQQVLDALRVKELGTLFSEENAFALGKRGAEETLVGIRDAKLGVKKAESDQKAAQRATVREALKQLAAVREGVLGAVEEVAPELRAEAVRLERQAKAQDTKALRAALVEQARSGKQKTLRVDEHGLPVMPGEMPALTAEGKPKTVLQTLVGQDKGIRSDYVRGSSGIPHIDLLTGEPKAIPVFRNPGRLVTPGLLKAQRKAREEGYASVIVDDSPTGRVIAKLAVEKPDKFQVEARKAELADELGAGKSAPGYLPDSRFFGEEFRSHSIKGQRAPGALKHREGVLQRIGYRTNNPKLVGRAMLRSIRRHAMTDWITQVVEAHALQVPEEFARSLGKDKVDRLVAQEYGVHMGLGRAPGQGGSNFIVFNPGKMLAELPGELKRMELDDLEGRKVPPLNQVLRSYMADGSSHAAHSVYESHGGWVVMPRSVWDEVGKLTAGSSKAERAWDIHKGVLSRALLTSFNVPWLTTQILSNASLMALSGTGPMSLIHSIKWYNDLSRQQKAFVDSQIGAEELGYDLHKPHMASTVNNGFYRGWRTFRDAPWFPVSPNGRVRFRPLAAVNDMWIRADRATSNAMRRGVLYKGLQKERIARMDDAAIGIAKEQNRLLEGLHGTERQQLDQLLSNPDVIQRHAQHVLDWMGDYNTMSAFERRVVGRAFMFYGWMRYSLRLAFWTLPVRHPLAYALAFRVGEAQREDVQRMLGGHDVLPYQLGNLYYRGGDGHVREVKMAQLNPLFNQATSVINDPKFAGLLGLTSPAVAILLDNMFLKSSFTGKWWKLDSSTAPAQTANFRQGLQAAIGDSLRLRSDYRVAAKVLTQGRPQANNSLPVTGRIPGLGLLGGEKNPQYKLPEIVASIQQNQEDARKKGVFGTIIGAELAPFIPQKSDIEDRIARAEALKNKKGSSKRRGSSRLGGGPLGGGGKLGGGALGGGRLGP